VILPVLAVKPVQSIAKADGDLTIEELGAALSAAVMGSARMVSDIGANLVTSRLAAYGFLAEAKNDGVTEYQMSAVLDERTCAFCESMDGKVFEVSKAFQRVEAVLSMDDPEELKIAAPWPDQSEEGSEEWMDASRDELAAMGYDVGPYHPGCRCIPIPVEDQGADGQDFYQPKPTVDEEDLFDFDPVETMSLDDFMKLPYAEKLKAIANGEAPPEWDGTFV
jgi:uncharacterized protein with gpF-like domain